MHPNPYRPSCQAADDAHRRAPSAAAASLALGVAPAEGDGYGRHGARTAQSTEVASGDRAWNMRYQVNRLVLTRIQEFEGIQVSSQKILLDPTMAPITMSPSSPSEKV